jgi:hypothetical protein
MNLLTEFLTTYDELSALNEAVGTDADLWLSRTELDAALVAKANEWQRAVASKFRGQIVSQGIIQFFDSKNQQENTIEPLARQRKGAIARWQADVANLENFNKYTKNPDFKINLHGSWYGYCFVVHRSVTNSQIKQQLVIDCVNTSASHFKVNESDILLYTVDVQDSFMYMTCVKHDNSAKKSTLFNAPVSLNMRQKTTAINDADMNTFLQTFITEYPKRIQYETRADGTCIPTAFHVPTLVNFYLEHLEMGSAIRQTLATYFNSVTLEPNPNPKQAWKSVQYLYNAIQQEFVMGSKLTPNKTATNAGDNVLDSHQYLISGRASSSTDFLHNGLKIEAKQGHYKTGTEVKIDNSHEAAYVIYFAYEGLSEKEIGVHAIAGDWILYRAIPD